MPKKFTADDGSAFWLSTTGNVHSSEAEALADENAETYAPRVQLFINSREWGKGQAAQTRRHVTEFLAFESTFSAKELAAAIEAMKAQMEAEKAGKKGAKSAPPVPPPPVPEMPANEAA